MTLSGWKNKLYFGDNLDILREHVASESVDLIYLDPPFNSNATYNVLFQEKSGEMAAAQITAFEDTWQWSQDAEYAYQEIVRGETGVSISFDLINPLVLFGALIGIAMPAVFSAMVMLGVGRNSVRMIDEIRRQFREIPGLKEGKPDAKPDYARCVDIATVGAIFWHHPGPRETLSRIRQRNPPDRRRGRTGAPRFRM